MPQMSKQTFVQGDFCPRRLLSKKDYCPRKTIVQGDSCPRRQLSNETVVQGRLLSKETFVQGDICPRRHLSKEDFSPRRLLSKETFVQGDKYMYFSPRTFSPHFGPKYCTVHSLRWALPSELSLGVYHRLG